MNADQCGLWYNQSRLEKSRYRRGPCERIDEGFGAFIDPRPERDGSRQWGGLRPRNCCEAASPECRRARPCGGRRYRPHTLRPSPRGFGGLHFHDCGNVCPAQEMAARRNRCTSSAFEDPRSRTVLNVRRKRGFSIALSERSKSKAPDSGATIEAARDSRQVPRPSNAEIGDQHPNVACVN